LSDFSKKITYKENGDYFIIKNQMSRTWLITRNNPEMPTSEWIEMMYQKTKAVYACGQLEKGKEGTYHIQAYFNYSNTKALGGLTKYDKKIHGEKVKVDNGADKYCMKEDTRVEGPWEFGTKPVQRNDKKDWDRVWEDAKKGDLEKIPKDILISHYKNIKAIQKDYMKHTDSDDLRGRWIWGPPGVGKSRKAREQFPNHYPKLCNKWFDGYQGEEAVIMDDIGLDHKCLGQQLKIWGDRYACILETKGGAVPSNFKYFVVTSQYTIEEIWNGDQATIDALKRRFAVLHIPFKIYDD